MEERVETTTKKQAAEVMIGFWFGIGVILAAEMMNSLEDCIEYLISRKCQ